MKQQRKLIDGMDCLPGQMSLFDEAGAPDELINPCYQENQKEMESKPKTVTNRCDCGADVISRWQTADESPWNEAGWDVMGIECPKCGRTSTACNTRTGEITDWITRRDAAISEAEFQRQQFSADCNEWMGRGNHPF